MINSSVFVVEDKLANSMPFLVSSSECCGLSFFQEPFCGVLLFNILNDLLKLEFRLVEKLLLIWPFSGSSGSVFVGVGVGVVGAVQHNLCSQSPFLTTEVEFDAPILVRQLT